MGQFDAINPFALFSLSAGAIALIAGGFVFARSPGSTLNRLFLLHALCVAYLSLAEFSHRQAELVEVARFWINVSSFWPFVFAFGLHFVLVLTERSRILSSPYTYVLLYAPALAISVLDLSTDRLTGEPVRRPWGWTHEVPEPNAVLAITAFWVLAMIALIFYLPITAQGQVSDERKRRQITYVLIGVTLPLAAVVVDEFIMAAVLVVFPDTSTAAYAVGMIVIGYAMWRHQLFVLAPAAVAEEILSAMADPLVLLTADGAIVTANRSALQVSGYSIEELEGRPLTRLFPGTSVDTSGLSSRPDSIRTAGSVREIEASLATKGGAQLPVALAASVMTGADGVALGIVCISRDISERKLGRTITQRS